MKFLLSGGGRKANDHRFGLLLKPGIFGIPLGVKTGMNWAADNEAFTIGFDPKRFFPWLKKLEPYKDTCLFVVVPDEVGNAVQTGALWRQWIWHFQGWPLAFVAQDGQEHLRLPDPSTYSALFIGGTTEWKEGLGAIQCIKRGQALGKHIHIGRVNYHRRYQLFRQIRGSKEFTCDGTRQRYEGIERTKEAWARYQETTMVLPLW